MRTLVLSRRVIASRFTGHCWQIRKRFVGCVPPRLLRPRPGISKPPKRQTIKNPDMPGFLLRRKLLRRGFQRFWRRDRNGFYTVYVLLDLVQQRAWLDRFFRFRLLGVFCWCSDCCATVLAENGFVAAHAWHEITREADKLVIWVEDNANAFLLAFTATRLQAVQIIPAIGMERVGQQRVAHDKPYLLTGHSRA